MRLPICTNGIQRPQLRKPVGPIDGVLPKQQQCEVHSRWRVSSIIDANLNICHVQKEFILAAWAHKELWMLMLAKGGCNCTPNVVA